MSLPMRILYFSRDYTPHDHRFLTSLAGTEHEIFYLRLEQRGPQLEDRPLPAPVKIVSWAGGKRPVSWRDGLRLLASLKRVLDAVKPDLIHAGPVQTAGLLSALSGFHPLVVASWGYDLLLDAERNWLWRQATRVTLRRADAFIGDCETIRQKALGYGVPAGKIVTFPWGIDLKAYSPSADRHPSKSGKGEEKPAASIRSRLGWDGCFALISTRGWEPIYGIEELARAFVLAARGRQDLRLFMLGTGSLAGRLREIFLRGGVLERVHFPGQVGQDDLPCYFRSADLYVSASHSDGTSISLLEALATGLPALVSDIPGNREWVTPGEVGWLFQTGDVEALAEAMREAADSGSWLDELGWNARRLAEERADWDLNFRELLHAYELATSGRPA
ncbi:MAG TPA: glycosyltransferase family 4 protein [Anaerolineales bacterium]|nr:glycosyltransferase family 4 protein [Anaerolineales bacterium]